MEKKKRAQMSHRNGRNIMMQITAALALAAMTAGTMWAFAQGFGDLYDAPLDDLTAEAVAVAEKNTVAAGKMSATESPTITDEYIAEVMTWERPHVENSEITNACESETAVRYELTAEERTEIESVVMAECGGEPREGIIAVAQCILNAAEREGVRPTEAIKRYGYTPIRKTPSEAVASAVSAVFDSGETVTDEPILYFYATYIYSAWHESQEFVTEIGNHRFFKAREMFTK